MRFLQAGQKKPLTLSINVWQDAQRKGLDITAIKKSRIMPGSQMSNGMRLKKEN